MQLKALVCPQALCVDSNPTSYTHIIKWFPTLVWEGNTKIAIIHIVSRHSSLACVWWWAGGLWEVRAHADWGFNMGGWPMFKVAHILRLEAFVIKAIKVSQKLMCLKQSGLFAITERDPVTCLYLMVVNPWPFNPEPLHQTQKHKESKPGSLKASGCLNNA